jgi:F-type H+-transporting ATPase subunit a
MLGSLSTALVATAAALLLSPAAVAATGAAAAEPHPGQAAAHGSGRGASDEHFSLVSLLLSPETQERIRTLPCVLLDKAGIGRAGRETYIEHRDFVHAGRISHVAFALLAALLILGLALAARRRLGADRDAAVLPSTRVHALLIFEIAVGAVWNLMKNMMGPDNARRYFPLIGTLAVYIFTMNVISLLPTGLPPTDNLNTNIVMGLTVFLVYNFAGIRSQGVVGYLKHFAGPVVYLAPVMVVIELVSHLVRPVSLSLRLMGNMTGDHNVLNIFTSFKIPLLPLPLMALGLLVCVVQTLVFVLLSTVYLSMATAHGHDEDAHGH